MIVAVLKFLCCLLILLYDERVCGAQNSYTVARVKRATSDQASMVSLGFHITFLSRRWIFIGEAPSAAVRSLMMVEIEIMRKTFASHKIPWQCNAEAAFKTFLRVRSGVPNPQFSIFPTAETLHC